MFITWLIGFVVTMILLSLFAGWVISEEPHKVHTLSIFNMILASSFWFIVLPVYLIAITLSVFLENRS